VHIHAHTHIHTSQAVLHSFKKVPGLKDFQQWLGEEIQPEASTSANMSLNFSGVGSHARLFEALAAMLSRNALNPADISILYKHYAEEESPPLAHYLY
jgi:negative elongation factor C/D